MKKKKFSITQNVKERSRLLLGRVKSSRVIVPKNKRKPKYKEKVDEDI